MHDSAASQAYRAIERLIVTLELAPGLVTTEGDLIERVGLGRTPVREAIHRLSWEGLVDIRPRAGLAIAPLNPADWLKILDTRRGVEPLLARSAARLIAQPAIERFAGVAAAFGRAVMSEDVADFLDADKAFDDAIAAAAENPFASRLAGPLQVHSRRFWCRYRVPGGIAEAADRHVAVLDAIVERDPERAGEEMEALIVLFRAIAEEAVRLT